MSQTCFCCFLKWLVTFSPQVTSEKILPSEGDPVCWWELRRLPFFVWVCFVCFLYKEHYTLPQSSLWLGAVLTGAEPVSGARPAWLSPALREGTQPGPSWELLHYCLLPTHHSVAVCLPTHTELVLYSLEDEAFFSVHLQQNSPLLRATRNFARPFCPETDTSYLAKRSCHKGLSPEFQGLNLNCRWIKAWRALPVLLCEGPSRPCPLAGRRLSRALRPKARPSLRGQRGRPGPAPGLPGTEAVRAA